jgi:hypothetical protein
VTGIGRIQAATKGQWRAHAKKDSVCMKHTKQAQEVLVSWVSCTEGVGIGASSRSEVAGGERATWRTFKL